MTADNSCAESGKSVTRGQQKLEVFSVATWGIFTSRKQMHRLLKAPCRGGQLKRTDVTSR
jgi:hypothetical protein